MNAALGGVSAGGIGTPELDVTQSGGGPCAFVAIQSGGNAGGVTLSKLSVSPRPLQQGKTLTAGLVQADSSKNIDPTPSSQHCLEGPPIRTACRRVK